jgi:hypothetical protein
LGAELYPRGKHGEPEIQKHDKQVQIQSSEPR